MMEYKTLKNGSIEISPGEHSVKEVLETIAETSYELARPVGLGFLQPFTTKTEDVDFSQFIDSDGLTLISKEWSRSSSSTGK